MGKEIEDRHVVEVEADLDDVWRAIATGPGIESWFMGPAEVTGDRVRMPFADMEITANEPGHRFAYTSPVSADGRFIAYDFLIEARDGGATAIRMVASGFLPQDDWGDEYTAMRLGHQLFIRTLAEYLTHFPGRTGVSMSAPGPSITDWSAAWAAIGRALGRPGALRLGDAVTIRAMAGTVFFVNDHTAAVRAPDALYRFVRGLDGRMLAVHQLFGDPAADSRPIWQQWLHANLLVA